MEHWLIDGGKFVAFLGVVAGWQDWVLLNCLKVTVGIVNEWIAVRIGGVFLEWNQRRWETVFIQWNRRLSTFRLVFRHACCSLTVLSRCFIKWSLIIG